MAALSRRATGGHEVEPRHPPRRLHTSAAHVKIHRWTGFLGDSSPSTSTTPSRRSTVITGGLQRRGGLRPSSLALCSAPPPNRGAARIASTSVLHLLHRIGSLQAPSLSALCFSFSVHVAHHDREEIREGRETGMCT